MAKTQVLRGQIIFKEASLVENLTNRILSISSDGTITDRPALSSSGFVTSALPSAQILVGNGSGVATAVAMTGVIAITNAGVTSIVDNSIVNADINSSAAIAYSKLNLAGGVVNADVSNSAAIAYSKLALTGSIVNADVAVGAAIARTKLASGTAYKIVVNGVAGALGEATITPSMAIVADSNGLPTASATSAVQIGYSSTLTGPIQAQLDTQIAGHTTAALLQSPTASENGFAITWNDGSQEWELTDPVIQGIPTGGATGTVLMKDSGTDYDASWTSLTLSDVSDVNASVDDVNLLTGAYTAGVTSAEITFLAGTTSAIQPQINLKLDKALTENYLFIGNSSNVAIPFAPGPDTYQLTSVGGVPTWTAPSSGGTVTSVQVAGGTTGLTFSGGPITTTGTITMGGALNLATSATGILPEANGGTGSSTFPGWLLASGGALTANNTVSGAFNIGFTNTAFGVGVAPGSITASTKFDLRGLGTTTDIGFRYADSANTPRVTFTDSGVFTFSPSGSSGRMVVNFNGVDDSIQYIVGSTTNGFANVINGTTNINFLRGYANSTTRWEFTATSASNRSSIFEMLAGTAGWLIRNQAGDTTVTNVITLGTSSVSNALNPASSTHRQIFSTGIGYAHTTNAADISFIHQSGSWTSNVSGTYQLSGVRLNPTLNFGASVTSSLSVIGFDWNPTVTALDDATHIAFRATSGDVLIGGTTITASAILDLQSTTRAFIPPRMTTAQKGSIGTPSEGMIVYDTDLDKLCVYSAATATWQTITSV